MFALVAPALTPLLTMLWAINVQQGSIAQLVPTKRSLANQANIMIYQAKPPARFVLLVKCATPLALKWGLTVRLAITAMEEI